MQNTAPGLVRAELVCHNELTINQGVRIQEGPAYCYAQEGFLGVKYASFFRADLSATLTFGLAIFLLLSQHRLFQAAYAAKMC